MPVDSGISRVELYADARLANSLKNLEGSFGVKPAFVCQSNPCGLGGTKRETQHFSRSSHVP